jgi:ribonuclease HI
MNIIIYTDGGCIPNPGRGGWAALIRYPDRDVELSGAENNSTNNRMELSAAINALDSLTGSPQVQVYTDSEYLKKGITEWLPNWRKRGWKRKGGTLANQDLWMRLDSLTQKHQIEWKWVRGHAGNILNEKVDRLVRQAINNR